MAGNRIIKTSVIAGFTLGVVYAGLTVLAPNIPGKPGRTMIPLEWIPKAPAEPGKQVPPGTDAPLGTKVTRLLVGAFFMGPFGAMAGLGVGLLVAAVFSKPDRTAQK